MKRFPTLVFVFFVVLNTLAQSPKREIRAGWLATVYRIDWPITAMASSTASSILKQKAEFTAILDSVKAANMNAVFFQVRPEADAFYNSAYEPWSAHLGGARGANPGYDPLAFAIEESHKRGIELHAWLNPYRYETSAGKYTGLPGDYKTAHPEWILDYAKYTNGVKTTDGIAILDPGNPAIRKLIKNIVGDIISKYDLDGVVFDDYFYAYAGTSATLDSYSQGLYKPANMTIANWRRGNVNKMVADVYDTIQAVKPHIAFGVSPFGIWTTQTAVATAHGLTLPSGITGSDMYEQIYCDPVAWMQQGKVDYISPQLYWPTTSTGQDYKKLCPWWSDVVNKYGKYFYSSMSMTDLASTYKAPQNAPAILWSDIPSDLSELKNYTLNGGLPSSFSRAEQRIISATSAFVDTEVGLQIDWNRNSTKNAAPGSVIWSIQNLWTKGKFTKYLREQKFTSPALAPAVYWKAHPVQNAPTNVRQIANMLYWDYPVADVRYAVYAVPNASVGSPAAFASATNLLGVSYTKEFDLSKFSAYLSTRKFAVAVLDRYGNEYLPAYVVTSTDLPVLEPIIRVSAHCLFVRLAVPSTVELYALSGVLIEREVVQGLYEKELGHGVYILRIQQKSYKLVF